MARMTEEEAWALDEYYTRNSPKLSGDGKSGFIARHSAKGDTMIFVDDVAATWLRIRAEAEHKSITEIIGELVREKIFAQPA
ncbi:hypothetical protein FACS1894137_19870 [Spirochaetia bacterium]|nr:hypothetical protein FACS1894137_19870 [Spirochaetia bacterium]